MRPPSPKRWRPSSGLPKGLRPNWAIFDADEHQKTWTYLRKKMVTHFGNMQSSRSFIDAMFGIRQRTDNFDNLDKFNANVVDAFKVVWEMLPQPYAPVSTPPNSAMPERKRSMKMSNMHGLHDTAAATGREESNCYGSECGVCSQISTTPLGPNLSPGQLRT